MMEHVSNNISVYSADNSILAKIRRRLSFFAHRKNADFSRVTAPMISITFDDAPLTAARLGAEVLEKHDVRGTYFISSGLMGQESSHLGLYAPADVVMRLHENGHEIACHTYSHLDCGTSSSADIEADLDKNIQSFTKMNLPPATTFAYPYGDVSAQAKKVLNKRFLAARALHKGIIHQGVDLNQAPGVGLEGRESQAVARYWMTRAKMMKKAWLVLYTHDVASDHSAWGTCAQSLEAIILEAKALGFEFVTFGEGASRVTAAD